MHAPAASPAAAFPPRLHPKVCADHEAMSLAAADWLRDQLRSKPDNLLCLASGQTPTRTYEILGGLAQQEPELSRGMRVLRLDEWGGLDDEDPATCNAYFRPLLIEPLGLAARYVGFRSQPPCPQEECRRISQWLVDYGPIDVCVLGLGVNGHLGFNEPAAALQPFAHVAALSPASQQHGMLSVARGRPAFGLTIGMAEILQSRRVLLLVSGTHKREPLRRLLRGDVTPEFPATFLWLHPQVTLLCDGQAWP